MPARLRRNRCPLAVVLVAALVGLCMPLMAQNTELPSEFELVSFLPLSGSFAPRFTLMLDGVEIQAAGLKRPSSVRSGRFVQAHLVSGLVRSLDRERSFHNGFHEVKELQGHALFDYYVDRTERRVIRGTKRAVKTYLLEESGLETTFNNWFDRRLQRRSANATAARGSHHRADYGLGFSAGLPSVSVTRLLLRSQLSLQVGMRGRATLFMRHDRLSDLRMALEYDADERRTSLDIRVFF